MRRTRNYLIRVLVRGYIVLVAASLVGCTNHLTQENMEQQGKEENEDAKQNKDMIIGNRVQDGNRCTSEKSTYTTQQDEKSDKSSDVIYIESKESNDVICIENESNDAINLEDERREK